MHLLFSTPGHQLGEVLPEPTHANRKGRLVLDARRNVPCWSRRARLLFWVLQAGEGGVNMEHVTNYPPSMTHPLRFHVTRDALGVGGKLPHIC